MEFYPHRTVEEQAERLPYEFQEKYINSQIDRIEIDGQVIQGYFEYSFLEEKSYVEQPTRSNDGTIQNIDSIGTFLTPRIIIKYNMMNIEDYRKLMKLIKSKNSFVVSCYDIVEDKRASHEMYFAPSSMPIIYQQYLTALGIKEYSIELIGTNRSPNSTILYEFGSDFDYSDQVKSWKRIQYNNNSVEKITVGNIQIETSEGTFPLVSLAHKTLLGWNTIQDGSGIQYSDNSEYYMPSNIRLFAQWGE